MARIYPGISQTNSPAGDVAMILGPDGGDIVFIDGAVQMTSGFKTAALLGLVGGNEDDPGTGDTSRSWWGNHGQPEDRQYRGNTGYLLATLAPTSNGVKRIQAAVNSDLAFLSRTRAASAVEGEARLTKKDQVDISGRVNADGREEEFNFSFNWRAQAGEFAGLEVPSSTGSLSAYWVDTDRNLFIDGFGRFFLFGR